MVVKKIKLYFNIIVFNVLAFWLTNNVWAQAPKLVPGSEEKSEAYKTGNYQLNDLMIVVVTISKWVLVLSGALALLAFVVGGFMFIMSAGNKDWVEKGKKSLIGATIGLVIVLMAYTAIDYFLKKIGYTNYSSWHSGLPFK